MAPDGAIAMFEKTGSGKHPGDKVGQPDGHCYPEGQVEPEERSYGPKIDKPDDGIARNLARRAHCDARGPSHIYL
ncbi:hypothetical protein GCM10028786_02720 [Flaviaesturariibacter terrae]